METATHVRSGEGAFRSTVWWQYVSQKIQATQAVLIHLVHIKKEREISEINFNYVLVTQYIENGIVLTCR